MEDSCTLYRVSVEEILNIRQEVVCIKQQKREGVKPEKPKERVLGCHGNVKEEMPILSVIQQALDVSI